MLAIINILLAIFLTVVFSINQGFQFDFLGIIFMIITLIVSFIVSVIIILIPFIVCTFVFEKKYQSSRIKHIFLKTYSMYIFRFINRAKLIVTGQENLPKDNNFVVYANHIEFSDPMFIMQAYWHNPIGFVAKDPLFKIFFVKNLLYSLGCIPISKYADRKALETILQAIKQVKEGQPMGIFPEGQRTYSNDLIDFKPGAFKVAQKAKADISPVCLFDMHELAVKRGLLPKKVYLHVLPLIKYEDYKDLDTVTLASNVKEMIQNQLNKYIAAKAARG